MDTSLEHAPRARRLRGLPLSLALIAGCATATVAGTPRMPEADEAPFLVSGMRHVVSIPLPAASCTRLTVPLEGTLSDVDLTLLDDAGQVLAADLREEGAPVVEICAHDAVHVHALVRVLAGAGRIHLRVDGAPGRASARASRADDVPETAFVDLDEPTPLRSLRVHAAELARRGFVRTEPLFEDVVPESRPVELALGVAAGTCTTLSVQSSADVALALVDAAGEEVAVGSTDGDVVAVQTCVEGAYRGVVRADAGTRITVLVAHGSARDVGGESGLWLGRATPRVNDDVGEAASPRR